MRCCSKYLSHPFASMHRHLIIKKLLGLNQPLGATGKPFLVPEWVESFGSRRTIANANRDGARNGSHSNYVDEKSQGSVTEKMV